MSLIGAVSNNSISDHDNAGTLRLKASKTKEYLSRQCSYSAKASRPKPRPSNHFDIHRSPHTHFDTSSRRYPRSLRRQNTKTPSISQIEGSLSILKTMLSLYTYESFDATVLEDMLAKHEYWNRSRHRLVFVHGRAGYHAGSAHAPIVEVSNGGPTMEQVVLHDSRSALVRRFKDLRQEKVKEVAAWRSQQAELARAEDAIERMWGWIEGYWNASLL